MKNRRRIKGNFPFKSFEILFFFKDIEEEDQEYLELFPNISQDILSSQCIEVCVTT